MDSNNVIRNMINVDATRRIEATQESNAAVTPLPSSNISAPRRIKATQESNTPSDIVIPYDSVATPSDIVIPYDSVAAPSDIVIPSDNDDTNDNDEDNNNEYYNNDDNDDTNDNDDDNNNEYYDNDDNDDTNDNDDDNNNEYYDNENNDDTNDNDDDNNNEYYDNENNHNEYDDDPNDDDSDNDSLVYSSYNKYREGEGPPNYYPDYCRRPRHLTNYEKHVEFIKTLAFHALYINKHDRLLFGYNHHIYNINHLENAIWVFSHDDPGFNSPYMNNIPLSNNIIIMYEDWYISSHSEIIIDKDPEFVIRLASKNEQNYLFYFCVDNEHKLVPSHRWPHNIWYVFNNYIYYMNFKKLNVINNYCNICYTFKNRDYCIICDSINHLK